MSNGEARDSKQVKVRFTPAATMAKQLRTQGLKIPKKHAQLIEMDYRALTRLHQRNILTESEFKRIAKRFLDAVLKLAVPINSN